MSKNHSMHLTNEKYTSCLLDACWAENIWRYLLWNWHAELPKNTQAYQLRVICWMYVSYNVKPIFMVHKSCLPQRKSEGIHF